MRVATALIALLLVACNKRASREAPPAGSAPLPPPAGSVAAAPPAAACTLAPVPHKRAMPKRLVAIGDLHGDLDATRSALRLAGAIDASDQWIGGDLVIVQTGDILDRGDDEQAILDLLTKLEGEARAAGGEVIRLLGNHELMNAAGDFRYVTPLAMRDFDDAPGLDTSKWARVPEQARGRIAALAPGGVYAKKLASHNVVAIVGDTVFSHAGVVGDWATQVDAANQAARCWLDGQMGGPDAPPPVLANDESPVWTRVVGTPNGPDCAAAKAALDKLGVKRMVVGHTVQEHINGACDGTVWRIDVGLAKRYGGPIEVLELRPDAPPKVLTGTR